jgi:orotidine-5'-phosphate decarboxylase
MTARERLILPLDMDDPGKAMGLARSLADHIGLFKVGPGLILAGGPGIVAQLRALDRGIFLDMKFHDIPETVARTCRNAAALGVDMLTVHASGGGRMVKAAVSAVAEAGRKGKTRILAVTVLTSIAPEELRETMGSGASVEETVERWAGQALDAGADGVVCSPREVGRLRTARGLGFLAVVPGIRSAKDGPDDQRRTMTAGEALRAGADYLVVGRPIIAAPDPAAAAQGIIREMEEASNG